MNIRTATQNDLPNIHSLLHQVSLPIEGVAEHVGNFLVAEVENTIIGTIGLEVYPSAMPAAGTVGLLRSAAVLPEFQKSGIGTKLYNSLISIAKEKQLTELYLFTNTAEIYFARKGFTKINREEVTGEIASSSEFRMNCCASAVCMKLRL
ncbi:MAG: GNAT family N-acetyltransferase [Ignavibacteriae bacterium]|nr:GNAT family N-acetyltransferase [Ignavibacteriota bacterium]